MNSHFRALRWFPIGALLVPLIACSDSEAEAGSTASSSAETEAADVDAMAPARPSRASGPVADAELEPYRIELLELAFGAASAMPLNPHVKNRARAQEAVVVACFELDQPRRALRYVEEIPGWRRGAGYADFAHYCAEHGDTSEVQRYLDRASKVADGVIDDENPQAWRRDRIRAKIARTHLLLGETAEARKFAARLEDSEIGIVETARVARIEAGELDQQLEFFDRIFETGSLEQARGAFEGCLRLLDRFYADESRRGELAERLRDGHPPLPEPIRIELMMRAAEVALDHGDRATALEWLKSTGYMILRNTWLPEDRAALDARLARLRFRAGDEETARADLDKALARFDEQSEKVVDIFRASALRPLAEAYHATGQRDEALAVYRRAVEEGFVNPNSRPRAEDLVATCLSMAVHGFEPDAELRARLHEIRGRLGDPW